MASNSALTLVPPARDRLTTLPDEIQRRIYRHAALESPDSFMALFCTSPITRRHTMQAVWPHRPFVDHQTTLMRSTRLTRRPQTLIEIWRSRSVQWVEELDIFWHRVPSHIREQIRWMLGQDMLEVCEDDGPRMKWAAFVLMIYTDEGIMSHPRSGQHQLRAALAVVRCSARATELRLWRAWKDRRIQERSIGSRIWSNLCELGWNAISTCFC